MRESRFIELLNLYVDQQLSSEEATELESEITANPARRRTYQQYCRIQRGCTLLFEKERSRAPLKQSLAVSLADADRKIVSFPARSGRPSGAFVSLGGLAAAACVAFLVINRSGTVETEFASTEPTAALVATTDGDQSVSSPGTEAQTRLLGRQPEFYSVATTRHLMTLPEAEADRIAADAAASQMANYRWMQNLELQPISELALERITLEPTTSPNQQLREFRPRSAANEASEMTAFEFRR